MGHCYAIYNPLHDWIERCDSGLTKTGGMQRLSCELVLDLETEIISIRQKHTRRTYHTFCYVRPNQKEEIKIPACRSYYRCMSA